MLRIPQISASLIDSETFCEIQSNSDRILISFNRSKNTNDTVAQLPVPFNPGAVADFLKEKTAMRERQAAYSKEV